MINLSEDSIFETETLFLQPSWKCAKNCQGCYVKEKESKFGSNEMDMDLWCKIITDVLWNQEYIKANQVVIALDKLPIDNEEQFSKMQVIGESYLLNTDLGKLPGQQVHITSNCINDLKGYLVPNDKFAYIDMVSLSNINSVDEIKEVRGLFPGAKINWNVMSSTFIKKQNRDEILSYIDMAYLLLHKAPLGEEGHDASAFKQAYKLVQAMREKEVPPTVENACPVKTNTDKIVFDGCIKDGVESLRTSFGCSSNISRFQIWPDGRVTGCAYNSHQQYGEEAKDIKDVVANLKDARNRYEFSSCTIPKLFMPRSTKTTKLNVI